MVIRNWTMQYVDFVYVQISSAMRTAIGNSPRLFNARPVCAAFASTGLLLVVLLMYVVMLSVDTLRRNIARQPL